MRMTTRALLAQSLYADVVGLRVDYENAAFTRLAGARGRSRGADFDCFAPFGDRRRCCVEDDGTINAFFGDPGYAEDGSNGQVMVYQPKFYYRVRPLTLTAQESGTGYLLKEAEYYVSSTPKPGFRLHPAFYGENGSPVDYILLSAYEASLYDDSLGKIFVDGTDTDTAVDYVNDRLCSLAGQKPIGGTAKQLTRYCAERLAAARGAGWHIDTIKSCAASQLLMIVECGTMNIQNAIARGVSHISDLSGVNCASLTGSTAFLGNATGVAEETVNEKRGTLTVCTAADTTAVSFRGQENPWGNVWKHINGVNIYYASAAAPGEIYIADDYQFANGKADGNYRSSGFCLPTGNGYVKYMGYGDPAYDWLFLPGGTGGSSTAPVGDYQNLSQSANGFRAPQYGGRWDFGAYGGPFCGNYQRKETYANRDFGCRLIFVPQGVPGI